MRKLAARTLVAAVAFTAALGHAVEAPRVLYLTWGITVDPDGHVTRLESDKKLPSELLDRLEKEIRGWRFKPGMVNGQSAATDSKLRVKFQVTSLDRERVALRVISANTGGYYGKQTVPSYPSVSVKMRREGLVLLQVRYDAGGRVIDAGLYPGAPHADKPLVDAALAAVRQWTFAPEVVGGHPLASSVLVPVCFGLNRSLPPKCDWSPPGGWGGADAETVQDGETPVFDSVLKLDTAVAGRTP